MEPVTHINYPIPVDKLLLELEYYRDDFITQDTPYHGLVTGWETLRENENTKVMTEVRKEFCETFGITSEACGRYYILDNNVYLEPHIDYYNICSVNWLLAGAGAPVVFGDKEYYYENAILDTTQLHSVPNTDCKRVLFKINFMEISYKDLINKCVQR